MTSNIHDLAEAGTAGDTLYASLRRAARQAPPRRRALAGLRDATQWVELDYSHLLEDIDVVSAHLAALGLRRGDVICLQLPNWTEAVVYTYAASRIGAVVCPITTIYRQRELSFILERTRCKVVVVPARYRGFDHAAMAVQLADGLPHLEHVVCVGPSDHAGVICSGDHLRPIANPRATSMESASADDLAILAFTSGTTGEPKGVMHTSRSMHSAIDGVVTHTGYGQELTSLVMSPFGHLTGFTWGILMPLRGRGEVVLLEVWDADRALDLFATYAVNFTMGATPFLSDLLDAARSRPEAHLPDIFVCGGAPIPPSLVEQAVRDHGSRVVAVWGMSEYPVGTATKVDDEPALASTSDGRPAAPADVVVVDSQGVPVQVGQEGDLLIRGPGLFVGYFERPELDAEALTDDGYLRTGDRARLLDASGAIRICGRTKDIIIRGGENIPVVEIENVLLTHPAIREIALVPLPHERLGETACACIVLQPDVSTELTVADLGDFLGARGVSKHFYPETVRLLDQFPRTPSGKIQKFALRDQLTV